MKFHVMKLCLNNIKMQFYELSSFPPLGSYVDMGVDFLSLEKLFVFSIKSVV